MEIWGYRNLAGPQMLVPRCWSPGQDGGQSQSQTGKYVGSHNAMGVNIPFLLQPKA